MTIQEPVTASRNWAIHPELYNPFARQIAHFSPVPVGDPHAEKERLSQGNEGEGLIDLRLAHTIAYVMRMAQDPAPITINNISASQAHNENDTQNNHLTISERAAVQSARRPSLEIIAEMFTTFFSSKFNRFCFFSVCGVGVYIYWSYLDHKWHMEQVQRRIDSNFLLRTSQWLFNDSQLLNQPRPQSISMPNPSRLLPSFW